MSPLTLFIVIALAGALVVVLRGHPVPLIVVGVCLAVLGAFGVAMSLL